MATVQFYKNSIEPTNANEGSIWFDSTNNKINLKTENGWEVYNGVKPAGSKVTPIYINDSGNAEAIDTTRFVTNNDVIQRNNVFVLNGGGIFRNYIMHFLMDIKDYLL